jgi:hypothetical protein
VGGEVKDAALKAGFLDYVVTNDGTRFPLPYSTLCVAVADPTEAMGLFIAVVRAVSPAVTIERAVAFDWTTGQSYSDLPPMLR